MGHFSDTWDSNNSCIYKRDIVYYTSLKSSQNTLYYKYSVNSK